LNNSKFLIIIQRPWNSTLRGFLFRGKMEQIDYTKLNERIVEQACEAVLTKEQLRQLIQDKFERARIYREALAKSPTFSVN